MAYQPPALPTVDVTTGPAYATAINAALTYVNNFLSAPIVIPKNVDVTGNLNFGGFGLTNLSGVGFDPNVSSTADLIYAKTLGGNDELIWNDSSGHEVKLTNKGFPASALGNIQGYPPGNLASITWTSGTPSTFTFYTSTTQSPRVADVVGGSYTFTDTATPIPAHAATLKAHSPTTESYDVVFPPAKPPQRAGLAMDTVGNLTINPGSRHVLILSAFVGATVGTGVGPLGMDPSGIDSADFMPAVAAAGGYPMPYAGTITALQILCSTPTTAPAINTFAVFVNGSMTAISVALSPTVKTGSATGSVSFSQGDYVQVGVTASTVSSGTTGTGLIATVAVTTG